MRSWENNVRRVVPYIPGEQPKLKDIIKLNTNENPYPPSEHVISALRSIDSDMLRRYPDPDVSQLRDAIAARCHVREDQVFVGVGSDDVLAMSFLTFFSSGRPILFPDITYSFYDVWADLFRIPYEKKSLDMQMRIVASDYYCENGGIVIANPNAPTGTILPLSDIDEIAAHNRDVVVIIDEAYIDFAQDQSAERSSSCGCVNPNSAMKLIRSYDNLLVVQTFSKSRALAGMRIGYAVGSSRLIRYLKDVRNSFNSYTMGVPSIAAGISSLEDDIYFRKTCGKIIATRERTKIEMKSLGFAFPDSQANFLFVTHEDISACELFTALGDAKIIVRHWDKRGISNFLRITIGTDEEMDALFLFLRRYLL